MKKKNYLKKALLLFISIHLMIAWVAEREGKKTQEQLILPSHESTSIPGAAKVFPKFGFLNMLIIGTIPTFSISRVAFTK